MIFKINIIQIACLIIINPIFILGMYNAGYLPASTAFVASSRPLTQQKTLNVNALKPQAKVNLNAFTALTRTQTTGESKQSGSTFMTVDRKLLQPDSSLYASEQSLDQSTTTQLVNPLSQQLGIKKLINGGRGPIWASGAPSGMFKATQKNLQQFENQVPTTLETKTKVNLDPKLVEIHNEVIAWRKTLTPEQTKVFKKLFKKYDKWFERYANDPIDKTYIEYAQENSNNLQKLMINLPRIWKQYENIQIAHQAIMQWRTGLTPEQTKVFNELFENYDQWFEQYANDPTNKIYIEYTRKNSDDLQIIIALARETFNPIARYFDFLDWKKQQSEPVLQAVQSKIKTFEESFEKFINNPNPETSTWTFEMLQELNLSLNNYHYQPLQYDNVSKEDAVIFHETFKKWEKQQSVENLKALRPFIDKYEKDYRNAFVLESFGSSLHSFQKFFDRIMHPKATINFMAIVLDIQTAHHELMQAVAHFSLEQQKLLEPLMKRYLNYYDSYQEDPMNIWSKFVIKKQISIAELLKKNFNMFKPVPGYSQKLAETAINLNNIQNLEGFFNAITRLKPEILALQHFQDAQVSSGSYVPLCSVDKSLGDTLAYYKRATESITIGAEFHDLPPAKQYHTLLHEYRHRLQNVNSVLVNKQVQDSVKGLVATKEEEMNKLIVRAQKFYPTRVLQEAHKHTDKMTWSVDNSKVWKPYEYDAESFATEHVTCPTCLKIIQSQKPSDVLVEGYFNQKDIEPFVQAARHNSCCPAHTRTLGDDDHNAVVQQLEQTLQEYKINLSFTLKGEIEELDKQSGTLLQHIPEYNRDFIRRIAHTREIQAIIGAKTVKELDLRSTMRKVQKDVFEGRYPMLEASSTMGHGLVFESKTIAPEDRRWDEKTVQHQAAIDALDKQQHQAALER